MVSPSFAIPTGMSQHRTGWKDLDGLLAPKGSLVLSALLRYRGGLVICSKVNRQSLQERPWMGHLRKSTFISQTWTWLQGGRLRNGVGPTH